MNSNAGASDYWDEMRGKSYFTSGSAIIPNTNEDLFFELMNQKNMFENNEKEMKKEYDNLKFDLLKWRINQLKDEYKLRKSYGIVIFSIVCFLLFTGLFFSGIQLYQSVYLRNLTLMETEMSLKIPSEFYIKTTVIGGFILVVSMIFFFLFLKYVFITTNNTMILKDIVKDFKKRVS